MREKGHRWSQTSGGLEMGCEGLRGKVISHTRRLQKVIKWPQEYNVKERGGGRNFKRPVFRNFEIANIKIMKMSYLIILFLIF